MRNMEREDFQAVADVLYEKTKILIEAQEQVNGKLIMFHLNEQHEISEVLEVPLHSLFNEKMGNEGKNIAAAIFEVLPYSPFNPDITVFMSEAWMVFRNSDKDIPDSIENEPDRKEAVWITLRTKDFEIGVYYPIDRETNTLTYCKIEWDSKSLSGRFAMPQERKH